MSLLDLTPEDLIDVLHFLFESDVTAPHDGDHLKAIENIRSEIYSSLYDHEYKYRTGNAASTGPDVVGYSENDDMDMPVPIDPFEKSNSVKPFVPATQLIEDSSRPFGRVLDAPLG